MAKFKHQQYSLGVTVTAEDMNRKPVLPAPWWMAPLIAVGLAKPRLGPSPMEIAARRNAASAAALERMAHEMRIPTMAEYSDETPRAYDGPSFRV